MELLSAGDGPPPSVLMPMNRSYNKHRVAIAVLVLFLLAAAGLISIKTTPRTLAASDDNNDFVSGEVLVQLGSPGDLAGVAAKYALDPKPLDQFGSRPIYRLRIIDGARVEDRVDQLVHDGRVAFAEPNFTQTAPEGSGNGWSVGNGWITVGIHEAVGADHDQLSRRPESQSWRW